MDLDKFNYECQGQMSIFDLTMEQIKIDKPIRLMELFGGYGSQSMALKSIGADFEHYKLVEFDKYAVASYNAIHGTDFDVTDIRDVHGSDLEIVKTDTYFYFLTYSFPCTDLSVAGKMKGMKKGSGTRSGLLWEVERLLTEIHDDGGELPQILFMENVPQVLSSANIKDFHAWQDFLTGLGYTNHVQVLNAKDYGVAQNRERAFMFSFLGEYNYKFPEPIPLTKTMKDYLEDEVDEKYYINTEKAQKLIEKLIENGDLQGCVGNINPSGSGLNGNVYAGDIAPTLTTNKGEGQKICIDTSMIGLEGIPRVYKSVFPSITAREYKDPRMILELGKDGPVGNGVLQIGNIVDTGNWDNPQRGRIYSTDGSAPALNTCGDGNLEPKIIVAMRGRNPDNPSDRTAGAPTEQRLEPNSQGLCNTITSVQKDNLVLESAILTPKRTDYGKEIRKAYENGVVKESRHNMTQLEPRTDGISNTLTTVQKDNLVLEKEVYFDMYNQKQLKDGVCGTITSNGNTSSTHCGTFGILETVRIKQATKDGYIDCKIGGVADLSFPTSKTRRGRVQDNGDTCPTITAGDTEIYRIESIYRIRKLTPRECGRLMFVSDTDITKMLAVVSNSQAYKQFGNSIVVLVMIAMFSNLNIQGLPRWDVIKQRYI